MRSNYYIPRSWRDEYDFAAQFVRKPSTVPRMPAAVESGAIWQTILNTRRRYPRIVKVIKDDEIVAQRVVRNRDELARASGWYWEKSEHMTLPVRFIPVGLEPAW